MSFIETNFKEVKENIVKLFTEDWALVTAGNKDRFNTMTVSWGSVGELWFKDTATIYIRPQRYTREFIDANDYFTISFYPPSQKDALKLCGAKSGRVVDKVKETGLTPNFNENAPFFDEAKIVLICKKMAKSVFDQSQVIDEKIMDTYDARDFHYIYYGEIEKVLISK